MGQSGHGYLAAGGVTDLDLGEGRGGAPGHYDRRVNDSEDHLDGQGRPEPPISSDEVATLVGFLDYQRATLEWKCAGLDAAGLGASLAPTTMTLGGLLKHMAVVEDYWFSMMLHDNAEAPLWDAVDWDSDPDWEWRTAAQDPPPLLRAVWMETVARSRILVAEALADGRGLGQPSKRKWPGGDAPSLRWILVHMIEEYARHNGHADLLRESVDGRSGE